MARKTKDQVKEELKKIRIEFNEDSKYDVLAKMLRPFAKFSTKVIEAALDAGLVHIQIGKFGSDKALKVAAIRHKPGLAARFIEKPPPAERKEVEYVEKELEFDVRILAGPFSDHVRKEGQEIERMIRRKGISVFDMLSMNIERNMVAEGGRKKSKVTIKYRKGT